MAADGEREGAELRVTDAERGQTVELLETHTANGYRTLEEFSERAGQIFPTDALAVPGGRRLASTPLDRRRHGQLESE